VHYSASVSVNPLLKQIGKVVRANRRRCDLTTKQLANKAALSLRFISQLESGQANISILKLAAVAEALGIELHRLIESASDGARSMALLGLRGAGKSSVGPLLAKEQGFRFVELDSLIEERAGLALAEVFSLHGEQYYRRLETTVLHQLLDSKERVVVALSGGIVHNVDAFERLKQDCLTIWLKADSAEYMRRVLKQGDLRPMANRENAMAELETLVALREPLYGQANLSVDTTVLSVDEVAMRIGKMLDR